MRLHPDAQSLQNETALVDALVAQRLAQRRLNRGPNIVGILIAVTIGGVALTSTLEKIHNSMKAAPVTPKPVVVTPETYYDSAKDECHMRDGSGVFANFTKWLPESLCDTIFSTYNIEEYAKEKEPGALVKPGRYDMVLGKKISDEREAKEAPPESPIYDTLQPGYVMGHGW